MVTLEEFFRLQDAVFELRSKLLELELRLDAQNLACASEYEQRHEQE